MKLQAAWEKRASLYQQAAKFDKLSKIAYAEGRALILEARELFQKGNINEPSLHFENTTFSGFAAQLYARGREANANAAYKEAMGAKEFAKAENLRAQGDIVWADAVVAAYGDIKITWREPDHACVLANGDIYAPITKT